jgi:hypothetical protein
MFLLFRYKVSLWFSISMGSKYALQEIPGLRQCRAGGRCISECIQQHKVVNGRVVSGRHDFHSGLDQLAPICLAFIAQYIILCCDDEGARHAGESWSNDASNGEAVGSFRLP